MKYKLIKQWIKSFYWSLHRIPPIRLLRRAKMSRGRLLSSGKIRGTPIVRYYWKEYLEQHQKDIRGRGLEIGTTTTIRNFGGQALSTADAIDLTAHSPEVTVVADLSRANAIPDDCYDSFVNQFTMHVIYNVEAALYHSIRILKPGGVLLINFSCLDYYFPTGLDMGTGKPLYLYHSFTPIQVENLMRRIGLTTEDYQLQVYGNLFTRIAYQMNMSAEEMTKSERDTQDAHYPLLICGRVVKPAIWQTNAPIYRKPWHPQTEAAIWNAVKEERV